MNIGYSVRLIVQNSVFSAAASLANYLTIILCRPE